MMDLRMRVRLASPGARRRRAHDSLDLVCDEAIRDGQESAHLVLQFRPGAVRQRGPSPCAVGEDYFNRSQAVVEGEYRTCQNAPRPDFLCLGGAYGAARASLSVS